MDVLFCFFCYFVTSLKRNITRARLMTGVLRHFGKAAWAQLIACSTVSTQASATFLVVLPVAGLTHIECERRR
jgi:hypothetical protein